MNTRVISEENVSVRDFYESYAEKLQLKLIAGEAGLDNMIREKSINRPALVLTGYFKYFAHKRLQLFGAGEMGYLRDQSEETQKEILTELAARKIPCIVVSRNFVPTNALIEVAEEHKIPLFRSPMKSKDFIAEATVLLEDKMAPRGTIHGTLLDIRGIGVLLRGKSGIGKSECALALIERGHSLVADDLIHLKLLAERELMGTSAPLSRGYMECRGIGIVNIAELFGIRSIRFEKRIDLVVTFIEWVPGMSEERTGLDEATFEILGQSVRHIEIPVRLGRDMARLVEVATMGHTLKMLGYDTAQKFNQRLIDYMAEQQLN